jgi:transposase
MAGGGVRNPPSRKPCVNSTSTVLWEPGRETAPATRQVRWGAQEVVLRLLRGETLDALARETGQAAGVISSWREEFLRGGHEGLKSRPAPIEDRRLADAQRKIGELAMDLDIAKALLDEVDRRLARRRGDKKAIIAIAHEILAASSNVLNTKEIYREQGPAIVSERDADNARRRAIRQLEHLGHKVTLQRSPSRRTHTSTVIFNSVRRIAATRYNRPQALFEGAQPGTVPSVAVGGASYRT